MMRRLLVGWLLLLVALAGASSGDAKRITNVFTDADIRNVLSEIASASNVTIIPDSSVKGIEITVELKEDTVESALDKVAFFGNLVWKKKDNLYLVSTGLPDAPLFTEFAVTKLYSPRTQAAESLFALLSRQYQTYATYDRNATVLSVTGPERTVQKIVDALTAIDAPREQFMVEAMVTEIRQEKNKDFGFSWSWKQFASDAASLLYTRATGEDVAKLKALIGSGTAKMRANPRVVAASGQEAMITVGNETYFPLMSGNANYPTVTLQRISTGITLKFTGYVGTDGTINLRLQPEVGDAVAQVNGAPTTTVRRADTCVRVKDGETIVLGGLIVDGNSRKKSKLPLLGDIPVVGRLFQSESTSENRTEVVIFITTHRLAPAG